MDFSMPGDIEALLLRVDAFIDAEIKPLQDANADLFDHTREFSRTDVERGGIPDHSLARTGPGGKDPL